MSRRPIGYYAHHQGAGHWVRATAIASAMAWPCTLIGTFDRDRRVANGTPTLALPDDRIAGFDGLDGEATRPLALHFAPLGVPAIRSRMAALAAWIESADPVLMIVDVSVEVAFMARLMSLPTLTVRLAGRRTDPAHLEAFRAAERLLAPFPPDLDDPHLPTWIRDKTIYAGLVCRPAPIRDRGATGRRIVVLFGRGGAPGDVAVLATAARSVPDAMWDVLGPVEGDRASLPANLLLHGWVEDVGAHLANADLVFGSAGDGTLAAVAAHARRFVCVPEARPFEEQAVKAEALRRLGAAVLQVGWKADTDWAAVVRAGLSLDPEPLSRLADPLALERTVAAIEGLAEDISRRPRRGIAGS